MQNIGIELKKQNWNGNQMDAMEGTELLLRLWSELLLFRGGGTHLLLWGDYTIIEATELLLRDGTILIFI